MNTTIQSTERAGCAIEEERIKGSVRILVIEDDPFILTLNARVLIRAGFKADTARDGLEGWNALCANEYDLVVTDNDMPQMTGLELIEKMRSEHINLPIILATGTYIGREILKSELFRDVYLLQKPFANADLVRTVNQFL